jgi:hypothetical protein
MPERPMTSEAATIAAEALCSNVIPFAPKREDEAAITLLANEIFRMCPTIESAQYVVRRAITLWRKWEGIPELRAILCSKYKPKDSIEGYSALYGDGILSGSPEPPARPVANAPLFLPRSAEEIERRRDEERNDPATKGALGFLAEAVKDKLDLAEFEHTEIPRMKALQDAKRRHKPPKEVPMREPLELTPSRLPTK